MLTLLLSFLNTSYAQDTVADTVIKQPSAFVYHTNNTIPAQFDISADMKYYRDLSIVELPNIKDSNIRRTDASVAEHILCLIIIGLANSAIE